MLSKYLIFYESSYKELINWNSIISLKQYLKYFPLFNKEISTFWLSSQMLNWRLTWWIFFRVIIIYWKIWTTFSYLVSSITYFKVSHHWISTSKNWTKFTTIKNRIFIVNYLHFLLMCQRKYKWTFYWIFNCSNPSPNRWRKSTKYCIKLCLNYNNSIRNIITKFMKLFGWKSFVTCSV